MYLKFKYKLMILLCMSLLLTTLLISGIWYKYSKEIIVDNVFQSVDMVLEERNRAFVNTIEDAVHQTRAISYNNSVVDRSLHNRWEDEYLNTQAAQKVNDMIMSVYINNPEIYSIEIGNYKGEAFSWGQKMGWEFIEENGLMATLGTESTDYLLFGYGQNKYKPDGIMLFRNLLYYGKNIGYCIVTFTKDSVEDVYAGAFPTDAIISVRGQGDSYLYTSSNYRSSLTNEKLMEQMNQPEDGHQLIRDDKGKEWLILRENTQERAFSACIAVPVENLLGDISGRFTNIFIISGIMMCILLLVVSIVTKWIGKNVDSLTLAMHTFSQGSMDATIKLNSKDEFGKVAEAFNIMTRDIRNLLEDIQKREKEKATLEIRSLQGQINLHFLFNTLNTIKNLCYVQRVTNVEHLVDALMQLLHISMEQDAEYVNLKKELEYTNCYLEIYQYKSVYPIHCYMNIEPGLEDALILKFTIQPIVENAIIHGLEGNEKNEEGIIFIKAIRIGEDIEITVTDNGKGFDTSKISTFNGIGLSNTERRIKIHFGEQYGITAESIEGISTSIKVRIPYRRIQDDEFSNDR